MLAHLTRSSRKKYFTCCLEKTDYHFVTDLEEFVNSGNICKILKKILVLKIYIHEFKKIMNFKNIKYIMYLQKIPEIKNGPHTF